MRTRAFNPQRAAIWLSIVFTLLATCVPVDALAQRKKGGGGSIQGGGGGDFSLSIFWNEVESIKSVLTEDNGRIKSLKHPLTAEQLKELRKAMDPKVTDVSMTDEFLFVKNARGEDVRVDAVNVPSANKIVLFTPAWQKLYESKMELKHLILHEFLGLKGINDDGYKISTDIFYPRRRPISFGIDQLSCYISAWMMYWDGGKYIVYNAYSSVKSELIPFSEPKKKGTIKAACSPLERHKGICKEKDFSRMTKTARVELPFGLWKEGLLKAGVEERQFPVYSLDISADVDGEWFSYGWGGNAGQKFYQSPQATLFAQFIARPFPGAPEKVMAIQDQSIYENDGRDHPVIAFTLENSEFYGILRRAGIRMEVDPLSSSGSTILSPKNVWRLMAGHAIDRGAKDEKEIDLYWRQNLLADQPAAIPLSAYVQCTFLEPDKK